MTRHQGTRGACARPRCVEPALTARTRCSGWVHFGPLPVPYDRQAGLSSHCSPGSFTRGACPWAATVLFALLGVAAPALADDDSTKAPDPNAPAHAGTERVEVTGKGAVVPPTSFVTVIRPSERLGAVAGLADLLSSSVGVRVRSYGGLNSFATVSIRGSTSEQVVVLIDGVPVNSPLGGGFDLSEIPLTGVDSIEVHRGFTPATLGSASIGGAVNIRTRTPEAGSSLQGSLACGSFGTTEATALGSVATGPMRWVLSGSVFTSRGDFTYLDNNATPLTTADDTFTTRGNNESRAGSFRATGRLPFGEGGAFTLAAEWLGRRRGVPGIDAFQSESASLGKTRALLRSDLSREGLAGGSLDLSAGLDGEYTSESFEDTDDPLTAFPVDTTTRIQGTGARFALTARPSTRQRITVLLQPRVDSVTVIDRIGVTSEPVKARRTMLSAVAENEIRFASGRFLLAPSLRYDAVATSSSGGGPNVVTEPAEDPADYSGRLGALWILTPRLSLRGNVGRYFRIPSLLELYGNEGTLVGNPVLTPERGTNADLGFTWTAPDAGPFARTLVEISAFRSATDDLIHMRTLATRQVKAFNTGAARITGIEASFSTRFLGRLDLSGNATLQHPEDRSDTFNQGHDLSGIPRQEASTAEALDLGSLWLFHRLNYIGENTIDALGSAASSLPPSRQEQLRLPARYLHDAGIRLKLGDRAFLTAEVLNLFDRHVVDVARYPLPGRTLLVRVEGSF